MRVRTGYSFNTAVGDIEEVMSRIKEIGWSKAPITDHKSTFGFTRWTKLCKKNEIQPIYGVELPCVKVLGEKKPTFDLWTFFAIDSLRSINDLISISTRSENKGHITYAQAMAQEGVYVVAGERLQIEHLPPVHERFFGGLLPSTPKGLVRRMTDAGLSLVAMSDNYYPRSTDKELYRVGLGGRRSNSQTYPMWLLSDDELSANLLDNNISSEVITEAFKNRDMIMANCNAEMKKAKLLVPEKPLSLRDMCIDGAKTKNVDLADPTYSERLDRELSVIREKEFEDYFFIIADIITFAKSKMVVGPARGSSCGSLVCYLLGITSVDPITHNLIFERFIDINRSDLPDVDIDFSDRSRDQVFRYAESKYGHANVARLGAVGTFKAKSSLKAAATSLKIPPWRIDKISDSIIVRQPGDYRFQNCLEDTLEETDAGRALLGEHPELRLACRLEGHPKNASQHAAGLLLTAEPISEFVAVDYYSRGAWCDKKDAEDLNLLKIDALGLTQLSVFERTLELIGEKPISGWLEQLPLDDPLAFEVLNKGKYNGIFQFNGATVKSLAAKIRFDSVDDLIAISAIARPGSMDSGGADQWIRRRNGEELPKFHPIYDRITAETYGVIVYQETVMFLCRELAGFDWPDTISIRKAIGKKLGNEELESWRSKFVEGCIKTNGLLEFDASNIWSNIVTFGTYGFNKAHAVAYGIMSYWCCWLKAHHPLAFAAATLDAEGDADKQISMLRELDAEGIGYKPVDIYKSTERWTIDPEKNTLLGPLTAIKGIGPSKVQEIIANRLEGKELKPGLIAKLSTAETEIDTLYPVADKIKTIDLEKLNIFSEPLKVNQIQPGLNGDFLALVRINRITPKNENSAEMITKRKGVRLSGPEKSINLFVGDDTDEIFAKIDRYKFTQAYPDGELVGVRFLKEAKAGKSLFAIKGNCPRDFRMISISNIRYIGEM